MSQAANPKRYVVIRASRETLGLLACAGAMTFAMSYAIHAKHARTAAATSPVPVVQEAQAPQQEWAGRLAALSPVAETPAERLSSAALVVPKSALALPQPPAKPKAARLCGDAACLAKTQAAATPKRQQVAAAEPKAEEPPKTGLLHQLNPLNHLPDISVVGRPFTYAGGAVAGWFKRL